MDNVYTYAFELTDDELTAVSGAGTGAYGVGGCGVASVPAVVGVPAVTSIPLATGCAAASGPYINAATNSAQTNYSYSLGLQRSDVANNSAFTMIN